MRKINNKLMNEMLNGELKNLLEYIKKDNELRLEVRTDGDAFVYYKKGKALGIKKLEVNKNYGYTGNTTLAKTNPKEYFEDIKISINTWLNKKSRNEFEAQQNIALFNQSIENKYIVLDMEYRFSQASINKENRVKGSTFDLLGLDIESKEIILFEVKTGLGANKGKSGTREHIDDFNTYFGKNSKHFNVFKDSLINDIKNIINDKGELGIFENITTPKDIDNYKIVQIFIFEPLKNESEKEVIKKEINGECKLLFVEKNNYKLK